MDRIASLVRPIINKKYISFPQAFGGEIVRKALHLLIAFVPLLAGIDVRATMTLLAAGTLFYVFAERLRIEGQPVLLISDLTIIASRERDKGRFVLGPVTLGVGAMLSLLLYPSTAAAIAIYALAFGDGFASLAGKLLQCPQNVCGLFDLLRLDHILPRKLAWLLGSYWKIIKVQNRAFSKRIANMRMHPYEYEFHSPEG